jgi:SSS family solute:Na+ symporter
MHGLGLVVGITAAYIIGTTLLGIWSVRYVKDVTTFMTAKNMLGQWIIGVLLMSEFIGPGTFIGISEAAYSKGIFAFLAHVSLSLAFLLYAYFMARKYNAAGEYTISGILQKRYGGGTRWIVSLVMIYALLAVNVTNLTGGAVTIAAMLNVNVKTASLILASLVAAIVASGGLRGIGISNLVHFVVKYMAIGALAITAWSLLKENPAALTRIPATHYSIKGTGFSLPLVWALGNIGAVFSTQYVVQSIASLRDQKEAFRASLIASILIIPTGVFIAYAGFAARGLFPNIRAVSAVPMLITTMTPVRAGIVSAGVIASGFVALSACILGATALFIKDFYVPIVKPSERHMMIATRVAAIVITFIQLPVVWYVPTLLGMLFFSRGLRASIGVLAVFLFYLPKIGSGRAVVGGLLCTIIGTTIWYALGNPFGVDNLYIAVGMPALAMFVDHFITKLGGGRQLAAVRAADR